MRKLLDPRDGRIGPPAHGVEWLGGIRPDDAVEVSEQEAETLKRQAPAERVAWAKRRRR